MAENIMTVRGRKYIALLFAGEGVPRGLRQSMDVST
jgi:hypothetical protein